MMDTMLMIANRYMIMIFTCLIGNLQLEICNVLAIDIACLTPKL